VSVAAPDPPPDGRRLRREERDRPVPAPETDPSSRDGSVSAPVVLPDPDLDPPIAESRDSSASPRSDLWFAGPRLCAGLRLLLRLGGGVVGMTRARIRASPLNLPKRPGRGSLRVTNSASASSTPNMSKAASRASSIVRPVVSTHSICQRAFRGLLSFDRGGTCFGFAASSSSSECVRGPVRPFAVEPFPPDARGGRPLPLVADCPL
jgi:hypothetical protein